MGCGYILAIVIVIHMVPNYEAKDFCHSYRENGFKVDFDYQNVISDTNGRLYIGSDYWKLGENLTFDRDQNHSSDWIRKNYRLYFGVNDSSVNIRGMWRKNVNTIDWLDYKPIVFNNTDFKPSFSFIFSPISHDDNYLKFNCFGEQSPLLQEPNEFRRRYECYYFPTKSGQMISINETILVSNISSNEERKKSGDTKNENNRLNGVFGRHQIITMFRRKDVWTGNLNFVILYQINQTIHYCLTKLQLFVDECEDLKELVDCSSVSDNTVVQVLLIIAIISIAIIVVIIFVLLCLLWVKMKTNKKGKYKLRTNDLKKKSSTTTESFSDSELSSSATSSSIPSASTVNGTHSQLFSVQSNVDYTKPILLKPQNTSSSEASVLKA